MKTIALIFSYIIATIVLSHCAKDPEVKKVVPVTTQQTKHYDKPLFNNCPPTITQGLYGCCTYKTGNCMPIIDTNNCKWYGVKRTIFIYEATKDTQGIQISGSFTWYSQINTHLIAQTQSDGNGCFQISLPIGQYSIFVLENNKYYNQYMSDNFFLSPVTVDTNKATKCNILINMAVD